jgi:hypothetical protein
MDKAEAHKILTGQRARFTDHAQLVPLVESQHVEICEVFGASGTRYQVEVEFFWDDSPPRAIRVVVSIDDGGVRAFIPFTETLLVSPHEHTTA